MDVLRQNWVGTQAETAVGRAPAEASFGQFGRRPGRSGRTGALVGQAPPAPTSTGQSRPPRSEPDAAIRLWTSSSHDRKTFVMICLTRSVLSRWRGLERAL